MKEMIDILQEWLNIQNEDLKEYFFSDEEEKKLMLPFGWILGLGGYTSVIDLDYLHYPSQLKEQDKEYVLVITRESFKRDVYSKYLGMEVIDFNIEAERTRALQEWIEEGNEEEEFYWLEHEPFSIFPYLEDLGDIVDYFFVEKGKPVFQKEIYGVNMATIYVLVSEYLSNKKKGCLTLSQVISVFEDENQEIESFDFEEFLSGRVDSPPSKSVFKDLLNLIGRDIVPFSNVILEKYGDRRVVLDLHEGQFLEVNGEVKLIDPFVVL